MNLQNEIIIPIISHIDKTRNKFKPNKKIKLNGQILYNNSINYFTRSIVIDNFHNYLGLYIRNLNILKKRIYLDYTFYLVRNYGDIKYSNIKQNYMNIKEVDDSYKPKWDLDNAISIWIKCVQDTLVKEKIIEDDTVKYIFGYSCEVKYVDKIKDMKLKLKIIQ